MACGAVLLVVTLAVNSLARWLVWSVAREAR
jgi:ABC-type phosphate transport system permease subunit